MGKEGSALILRNGYYTSKFWSPTFIIEIVARNFIQKINICRYCEGPQRCDSRKFLARLINYAASKKLRKYLFVFPWTGNRWLQIAIRARINKVKDFRLKWLTQTQARLKRKLPFRFLCHKSVTTYISDSMRSSHTLYRDSTSIVIEDSIHCCIFLQI